MASFTTGDTGSDASDLKDLIITAMNTMVSTSTDVDPVTPIKAQNALAGVISNFIHTKLKLFGTLAGSMIPGSPSVVDPLNGSKSWNLPVVSIQGSVLLASVQNLTDPSTAQTAWKSSFSTQISLTLFSGLSGGVTIAAKTGTFTFILSLSSSDTTQEVAMLKFAKAICNCLNAGIPPAPVAGIVTSGGGTGGTLTFSGFGK